MRYLACVLACEGNSDRTFFPELLKRALEELCAEHVPSAITVLPIRVLDAEVQRPESVLAAVRREEGTFDLVFFHHDGAPPRMFEDAWGRMSSAWDADRRAEPLIAVGPIRETEAWMLADAKTLADVLGVAEQEVRRCLPQRRHQVESISDPKELLAKLLGSARGRRRRAAAQECFIRLAEEIPVTSLKELPSFRQWWEATRKALDDFGFGHG